MILSPRLPSAFFGPLFSVRYSKISYLVALLLLLSSLTSCTRSKSSTAPDESALATDACAGDQRYGVAITNISNLEQDMKLIGANWYLDYTIDTNLVPKGCDKVLKLKINDMPTDNEILASAKARPGSYWIIGNEPNVPGQDEVSPAKYAEEFQRIRATIKEADSSAKIVAPEVLNFNTTCVGCSGFTSGRQWLEEFRASYKEKYGQEPPIDVWSIHSYDLDWTRMPMLDYESQVRELTAFRRYLDSIPGNRDRGFWLTEFAVLWGFDGIQWLPDKGAQMGISQGDVTPMKAHPVGELRTDLMTAYLTSILEWLEKNSASMKIEKWFVFSSHGHMEPWATASSGVALLRDDGTGSQLTTLGTLYRERSQGSTADR